MDIAEFIKLVEKIGFKSLSAFCIEYNLSAQYIYTERTVNMKALQIYEMAKEIYLLKEENKRLRDLVVKINLENAGVVS